MSLCQINRENEATRWQTVSSNLLTQNAELKVVSTLKMVHNKMIDFMYYSDITDNEFFSGPFFITKQKLLFFFFTAFGVHMLLFLHGWNQIIQCDPRPFCFHCEHTSNWRSANSISLSEKWRHSFSVACSVSSGHCFVDRLCWGFFYFRAFGFIHLFKATTNYANSTQMRPIQQISNDFSPFLFSASVVLFVCFW